MGHACHKTYYVYLVLSLHPLKRYTKDLATSVGDHSKIHLIRPGCLRLSIASTVQNRDLKHHSFILRSTGRACHQAYYLSLSLFLFSL